MRRTTSEGTAVYRNGRSEACAVSGVLPAVDTQGLWLFRSLWIYSHRGQLCLMNSVTRACAYKTQLSMTISIILCIYNLTEGSIVIFHVRGEIESGKIRLGDTFLDTGIKYIQKKKSFQFSPEISVSADLIGN